ncbi:MAG: bifunctional UDP-sugar hydrolase/5'-nucleotidase [Halobacteriaceae archaeon]
MGLRILHYSDIENAYDTPDKIGRLSGLLRSLRDQNTIIVGTGDNTSPGVLSLITEGAQALHFFSRVEPDFETFGNHDFDYGLERTKELVDRSPQQWISSNISYNGTRFGAEVGVSETATITIDGTTIGLFGVLDDATPALNPKAGALSISDPIQSAKRAIKSFDNHEIDYIIALSHLGQDDKKLAAETDVDVILGGHIHSERLERFDDTVLTRPGVNGKTIYEIIIDESIDVVHHSVQNASCDNQLAATLRQEMEVADLDETIATVDEPIERTEASVFRGESRIGNFVADAYRWASEADIGFQNSGGIREGPPLEGDVTKADLISIVPFQEHVSVAELTGEELVEFFSHCSGKSLGFGESDWWHAHISGATLTWNTQEDELESIVIDDAPISLSETYTLATTDYLFYSDREFPVLDDNHRVRRLDHQYEILIKYAKLNGIQPEITGRIKRISTD